MESKKMDKVLKNKKLEQKEVSTEILALVESGKWGLLWKGGSGSGTLPIWFLEYSILQNCFHIDTIDRITHWNKDMAVRGSSTGYTILEGPMMYSDIIVALKRWKPLVEKHYGRKAKVVNGTIQLAKRVRRG